MDGDWVWKKVEVTGSTNVDVVALAREHAGRVVMVSAQRQESGRGRAGRAWASPAGGAWFSLGFPVGEEALETWTAAPLVAGLAACEAVNEVVFEGGILGCEVKIKWPNDLVTGGRKVGGLLCEMVQVSEGGGRMLVVGIGINLNLRRADLPGNLRFPGTTLREETGREFGVETVIEAAAKRVVKCLARLADEGFEEGFQQAVEARMAWMGEEVGLDVGDCVVKGRMMGVDERGRLKTLVGGVIKTYDSGEVRVMGESK